MSNLCSYLKLCLITSNCKKQTWKWCQKLGWFNMNNRPKSTVFLCYNQQTYFAQMCNQNVPYYFNICLSKTTNSLFIYVSFVHPCYRVGVIYVGQSSRPGHDYLSTSRRRATPSWSRPPLAGRHRLATTAGRERRTRGNRRANDEWERLEKIIV